jgi:uncharacterized membrane protein YdjX (TVP38/TMEM64 family)
MADNLNSACHDTSHSMKLAKTFIVIFVIIDIAAALLFLPFRDWFAQFEQYVKSLGTVGPIAVAFTYVVTTILFIPGSALTIGSGTLFGLQTGFIVVLIGANLGALCAFLLARTLLREKVAKWAEGNTKFHSLDRAVGSQGFKMVFLSRLSPAFPFNLLNYLLGLTAIPTRAYILANLLGMLPGIFLYVYIGAAARDAIAGTDPSTGMYQQVLKYVGLLATIAVVIIVTRLARKAMREAEQVQETVK